MEEKKVIEKEEKVQGKVTIGDKAKNQMGNNKKGETKKVNKGIIAIIAVVIVVVVAIVIMAGFRIANKAKLDKALNGILNGEVKVTDTETETTGNLGKVEQAAKEYFKEYTDLQEKITEKIEDEKIQKMLAIENFEEDGPDFEESKRYIEESRQSLENEIESLKSLTSEEGIMSKIKDKKVSSYYEKLYKDYFFGGQDLSKDFEEVCQELDLSKQIMNTLYDSEIKILNFLTENKEHWKVQNSRIAFDSASILAQYNSLKTQFNAQ